MALDPQIMFMHSLVEQFYRFLSNLLQLISLVHFKGSSWLYASQKRWYLRMVDMLTIFISRDLDEFLHSQSPWAKISTYYMGI